jgi:hypothetical protein
MKLSELHGSPNGLPPGADTEAARLQQNLLFDEPTKVPIKSITANLTMQARVGPDQETIDDYSERMQAGIEFPPVIVFFDGKIHWLADGFQRHAAAMKAGLQMIPAIIKNGTRRDAILHAVGANANHGLRRTNADKRKSVKILLDDPEWSTWSDRQIAKQADVSNRFVSNLRVELSVNGSQIAPLRLVRRGESVYRMPLPPRTRKRRIARLRSFRVMPMAVRL